MRLPLPELLFTLLLAAAFASAGDLVLRRVSRRFADANVSMLVGLGLGAALLFPLTLVVPREALAAVALALAACLVGSVAARVRNKPGRNTDVPARAVDPVAAVVLAAVVVVAAGFLALNFRYNYLWDGFLIWGTKAQLLSHHGGLTRQWLVPEDLYDLGHLAYPNAVPLYESLLSQLRGGFDYDRLKPVFAVFYLSLLVGTYSAARAAVSARLAAMATLLVALVPALSTRFAAGAYADMPQAAFVAGVVFAGVSGRKRDLPWSIGAMTTAKAEGSLLAAAACGAVLLVWLMESPRALPRRIAAHVRGIAVVAAFFILRVAYVRWVGAPEFTYTGTLPAAIARIPEVLRLCALQLVDVRQWGLFWPAFFAAAVVLFVRGSHREKALTAAALGSLALMMVPFLFTSWPVPLQIEEAYFRLAAQIAPAASVAMVLAYARLARPRVAASATGAVPQPGLPQPRPDSFR